jgi:hypothetical protein
MFRFRNLSYLAVLPWHDRAPQTTERPTIEAAA